MAHARVEPDVEDVFFLGKIAAAASGATETGRRELRRRADIPGVRAFRLEDGGDVVADLPAQDRLAALVAVENRNRHAPGALPRDAPVGPAFQHAADALAPPGRDPL